MYYLHKGKLIYHVLLQNTIPIADDEGLPALVLSTDQVAQSQYSPAFIEIEGNRMLRATNVPGNPIYYWMPLVSDMPSLTLLEQWWL